MQNLLQIFLTEITNETLDKDSIVKIDNLTKFKVSTVLKADKIRVGILDIGSASGKFLFHSRSLFKFVQGVEVNKACTIFADKELKIKLVESIDFIDFNRVITWILMKNISVHSFSVISSWNGTIVTLSNPVIPLFFSNNPKIQQLKFK